MGQDAPGNAGGGFGGSFPVGLYGGAGGAAGSNSSGGGGGFLDSAPGPVGAARQAARGAASAG